MTLKVSNLKVSGSHRKLQDSYPSSNFIKAVRAEDESLWSARLPISHVECSNHAPFMSSCWTDILLIQKVVPDPETFYPFSPNYLQYTHLLTKLDFYRTLSLMVLYLEQVGLSPGKATQQCKVGTTLGSIQNTIIFRPWQCNCFLGVSDTLDTKPVGHSKAWCRLTQQGRCRLSSIKNKQWAPFC